jgi:O-antigen ligase
MGNANFAAAYAGVTASIAAGFALGADVKPLWRWAAALLAGVLFALSAATESLQGPVAGAVGIWIAVGVFARLRSGEVTRWLFRVWAVVSALVGAVLVASLLGVGPVAALWQENTFAIRVEYGRTAINMMGALPVFGSGPEGFARYLGEFRPESYVKILGPANIFCAAHNIALNWGATLGIVAMGFWVLSIGAAVWFVIRSLMNRGRPASRLLAGIAGGLAA